MTSCDDERFRDLRFRADEGWVGTIILPRFAECHDVGFDANFEGLADATASESVGHLRNKARHSRRQKELLAGRFPLRISALEHQGPTEAQREAYDELIAYEAEVLDAVLAWLLEIYRDDGFWTLDGFVQHRDSPHVESTDDLKKCLRLESVFIADQEDGAAVPIVFNFSSPLDDEHGIEVTMVGQEVEDPYGTTNPFDPNRGQTLLAFPFNLPSGVDAEEIESSADGHRFVELLYGGHWSGIYVLDPSLQCVGSVANSCPRPLTAADDIQGVRALPPMRRWTASARVQKRALASIGFVNWMIMVPCLAVAWMYEPRLFWACIGLAIVAHTVYFAFGRASDHVVGLTTGCLVLSIAGLVYANRASDFGTEAHVAAVTGVFGLILWWGTTAITTIASIILIVTLFSLRKEFLRDGFVQTFMFVSPGILFVAALALGLLATTFWDWSALHLLWITPASLVSSLALFLTTFLVAGEPPVTPCPFCDKPLASPQAKQCLHCGADWHRT